MSLKEENCQPKIKLAIFILTIAVWIIYIFPFFLIILLIIAFNKKISFNELLKLFGLEECVWSYFEKLRNKGDLKRQEIFEKIKQENEKRDNTVIEKVNMYYPKSKIQKSKNVILPEEKKLRTTKVTKENTMFKKTKKVKWDHSSIFDNYESSLDLFNKNK